MPLDSSSILDSIESDSLGLLIESSLAKKENRDNAQKAVELSNNIANLEAASGKDKALIASVGAAAELSAQKNKLKVANAAGVDPSAAMDSLLETISQLQATHQKTRNDLIAYNALKDQGIFNGGPLNWIKNAVNLENAGQAVETGVKSAEILTQQVGQINNVVQQTAITHNAIKESITEASIEANNRVILNDAQIKANQASLDALKYNSTLINSAKEATKERLAALYNLQQARNAEIQLTKGLESLALSKEEFNWRRKEREISEQAKSENKEADDMIAELISIGRAARGAAPLDARSMKSMLQIFKTGGAAAKELYRDYENGQRTKTIGTPMLGATPAESLETLQLLGSTVAAVRDETMQLFKDAKDAVAQNKTIDPKNKAAVDDEFNKIVRNRVASDFALIKPGAGNIFDVGDLRSYLGNSTDDKMGVSSMKNLAISQKLLIPAIEANQPMHDPKVVLKLAIAGVRNGTISSSEYLELADIYRRANEINQSSLNLVGLGIVPPNNGKNYKIRVDWPFSGTIDMTDPVALGRQLSIELSSSYGRQTPRRSLGF